MTKYGDGWRNVNGHTGLLGLQLPFWRVCPSSACSSPSLTESGQQCGEFYFSKCKTIDGVDNVYRAFDLEKRQHLFANNIIQPLQPDQVGFYGMGRVDDLGVDIQEAEDELEKKWSQKKRADDESDKLESIKASSLEPAVAGSKSDILELHGGDIGLKGKDRETGVL